MPEPEYVTRAQWAVPLVAFALVLAITWLVTENMAVFCAVAATGILLLSALGFVRAIQRERRRDRS